MSSRGDTGRTRRRQEGGRRCGRRSLSADDQQELAERFLPSRPVTNRIWLIIVWIFGVVLVCATLALIGAVFVSIFREETDTALVQILLTVFTTVAGILAGFISGRTSAGATTR
jgi:hypothetical protein